MEKSYSLIMNLVITKQFVSSFGYAFNLVGMGRNCRKKPTTLAIFVVNHTSIWVNLIPAPFNHYSFKLIKLVAKLVTSASNRGGWTFSFIGLIET